MAIDLWPTSDRKLRDPDLHPGTLSLHQQSRLSQSVGHSDIHPLAAGISVDVNSAVVLVLAIKPRNARCFSPYMEVSMTVSSSFLSDDNDIHLTGQS